ncbi:MAG: hypothetical protein ACUZ8H_09655 [Candidatus Anammoxibacter sp.]
MWKLISIITTVIFFTIFFIQNMVYVPVRFIATNPVDIRLSYIIIVVFAAGYLFYGILYVAKEAKMNRRRKIAAEEVDEDEDDDNF